jgi:hypothetical protein
MASHRQRRRDAGRARAQKAGRAGERHPRADAGPTPLALADAPPRLALTRRQAAAALGVSLSTIDRRVVPRITSVLTEWGTRLIPLSELERFLQERAVPPARPSGAPAPGRGRAGIPAQVLARIRALHAQGRSLGQIARQLDADGVPTAQGGRRWWPSTVRAAIARAERAEGRPAAAPGR